MKKEYFNSYDNPERARRVWNAYIKDVKEEGEEVESYFRSNATEILEDCSNVWDLDCGLTKLIAMAHSQIIGSPLEPSEEGKVRKPQHIQNSDGNWSHVDPDATGSWSLSVRLFENERRN